MTDKVAEYEAQRDRLRAAGVGVKFGSGTARSWLLEVEYLDREGIEDLYPLTSVVEVDNFLGSFCPECLRLDRRRKAGGLCPACQRAAAAS
jgi:hypothetical protein